MELPEIKVPKVPERPNPKQFRLLPVAYIECIFCDYEIPDNPKPRKVKAGVPKRSYKNHLKIIHKLVKRAST